MFYPDYAYSFEKSAASQAFQSLNPKLRLYRLLIQLAISSRFQGTISVRLGQFKILVESLQAYIDFMEFYLLQQQSVPPSLTPLYSRFQPLIYLVKSAFPRVTTVLLDSLDLKHFLFSASR